MWRILRGRLGTRTAGAEEFRFYPACHHVGPGARPERSEAQWMVDALCGALQRETGRHHAPQVVATEVRQKLGSLRYSVRMASARQWALFDYATLFPYAMASAHKPWRYFVRRLCFATLRPDG